MNCLTINLLGTRLPVAAVLGQQQQVRCVLPVQIVQPGTPLSGAILYFNFLSNLDKPARLKNAAVQLFYGRQTLNGAY